MHLLFVCRNIVKPRKALKFEIHLAEHCNLSCAGGNHFSPLAHEEYLDINSYKKDCKRIAELTGGIIESIKLLGGEPLLHPNLLEIICISRQYFSTAVITILTNGILLSKQSDEFWSICKENNIGISISQYPIKLDIETIEKFSKQFGIKVNYSANNIDRSTEWRFEPLDITGTQDASVPS